MQLNKIYNQDVMEFLKSMPSDFVNCVITSPPYWGLRDYGESASTVWDGEPDCEHEWDNIDYLHPTRGNRGEGIDPKHQSAYRKRKKPDDRKKKGRLF